ncbi:hypothetical protein CEXT_196571 [Caerostris extrusa]|uniref:Uncharacterized protein n=1 Tax=Caerostris extrusa TaxID=172846 RepID=A0AAV4S500_CAEEX|nr:hypothetical protein CEXT_196571 [Caerostris extrusa]
MQYQFGCPRRAQVRLLPGSMGGGPGERPCTWGSFYRSGGFQFHYSLKRTLGGITMFFHKMLCNGWEQCRARKWDAYQLAKYQTLFRSRHLMLYWERCLKKQSIAFTPKFIGFSHWKENIYKSLKVKFLVPFINTNNTAWESNSRFGGDVESMGCTLEPLGLQRCGSHIAPAVRDAE